MKMAQRPVICRLCKKHFQKDMETKDKFWVNPVRNMYYHKKCYDEWVENKIGFYTEKEDDFWYQSLLMYLTQELKIQLNFALFGTQWKSIAERKFITKATQRVVTPKGAYFTIKYFYEISKANPEKGNGGIGIISYIYEEACDYWAKKEERERGICEKIEAEARKMLEQKIVQMPVRKQEKKKQNYSLQDLKGDDN